MITNIVLLLWTGISVAAGAALAGAFLLDIARSMTP